MSPVGGATLCALERRSIGDASPQGALFAIVVPLRRSPSGTVVPASGESVDASSPVSATATVASVPPTSLPRRVARLLARSLGLILAGVAVATCAGLAPTAQAAPLFADGFESGSIDGWRRSGDVTQPNPIVDGLQARTGTDALHFQIPAGGGRRDVQRQFVMPKSPSGGVFWWKEGDDAWFGFSYYLDPRFPSPSSSWYDLTQWWNTAGGSPPIELGIPAGRRNYWIHGGYGSPQGNLWSGKNLGPVVRGRWIDWVVHVVFSADRRKGRVDVWRDGARVASNWHPTAGTLYPGGNSYVETGIYRATEQAGATLWQDDWTIGSSFAEVDPAGFGAPAPRR